MQLKRRAGAAGILGGVVAIAVGLILFATIGIIGLQLLATAGTTSFQPTVVLLSITVVSVFAAIGAAMYFLRHVHL